MDSALHKVRFLICKLVLTLVGVIYLDVSPQYGLFKRIPQFVSILSQVIVFSVGSSHFQAQSYNLVSNFTNVLVLINGCLQPIVVLFMMAKRQTITAYLNLLMTLSKGFLNQVERKMLRKINWWDWFKRIFFFVLFVQTITVGVTNEVITFSEKLNSLLGLNLENGLLRMSYMVVEFILLIPISLPYCAIYYGNICSFLMDITLLNCIREIVASIKLETPFRLRGMNKKNRSSDIHIVRVYCLPEFSGVAKTSTRTDNNFQELHKLLSLLKRTVFMARLFFYIPSALTLVVWTFFFPGLFNLQFTFYFSTFAQINGFILHMVTFTPLILNQIFSHRTQHLTVVLKERIFEIKDEGTKVYLKKVLLKMKDEYPETPCLFQEFDVSFLSTILDVTVLLVTTLLVPS